MDATDAEYDAFFTEVDNKKQMRFEERVCSEILRGLGKPASLIAHYRSEARSSASAVDGFTPEWLSDYEGWPIVFRAVRDYHVEKAAGFPDLVWLLDHRLGGPKTKSIWEKLWLETLDRYNTSIYAAVCFKPDWASHTVAIHNYSKGLTQINPPVKGGAYVWMTDHGLMVMQYLRDLLVSVRQEIY